VSDEEQAISSRAQWHSTLLFVLALGVSIGGLIVLPGWTTYLTPERTLLALTITLLIAFAERFPLQISAKVKVVVDTSLIYAALLLFPPPLAATIVGVGGILGNLVNRTPFLDMKINVGAAVTGITMGQGAYLLAGGHIPPVLSGWRNFGALVTAAVVDALTDRAIVAMALAFYLNTSVRSTFTSLLEGALKEEVALYLLGLLTVMVVQVHAWGLLLTAIPIALVYLSLRNNLRLQVVTRDAVEKMADVIDRRDPYTAGHSIRVSDLAMRIAVEMGLPWDEVETIRAAARVHDLGKIEIDSVVLNKPGRLDDREWELMRRHPIVGAEIIARFPEFARGADYIRYHHERWDGKGYPYGLRGEEIPLGARVIAVADAYDAMATTRPYRHALSLDVVMGELKKGAGVQWDPHVVAAFLRILGERKIGPGEEASRVTA